MSEAAALEAENELLRAQIERLQEALGVADLAPVAFNLTSSEARVFGLLMKRAMATTDMIMLRLYAGRPDDNIGVAIVHVFICHMRRKLSAFGVQIETMWGQGYRMTPESKAKARSVMASEGLAA